MRSNAARALALLFCGCVAAACSALVDTSGLSGGADAVDATDATAAGDVVDPRDATPGDDGGTLVDATDDGDAAPIDYPTAVLADGPYAYWRMQEASGTTANDETGAHDALYAGNVVFGQAGPSGATKSVRYAGGAHIRSDGVGKHPVGTFDAWTIETFVASEVPAGTSQWVWAFSLAAGGGTPQMWIDDTTRAPRLDVHGTTVDSLVPFATTAWHHVAVTFAAGALTTFVDGAPTATASIANGTPDRTGPLAVAGKYNNVDGGATFGGAFTGRLAEFAIYAKALPPSRIAAHYAARGP